MEAAIIPGETKIIKKIEKELMDYFDGKQCRFETPLILIGSLFQKSVWATLQKIPPGETRSYLDIANTIKNPTAFRAVANANGANQLAIIIPCHRVINANGELGGHVSINTTNIYAEVNLEMKAKALACCEIEKTRNSKKHWRDDRDLMNFLDSI